MSFDTIFQAFVSFHFGIIKGNKIKFIPKELNNPPITDTAMEEDSTNGIRDSIVVPFVMKSIFVNSQQHSIIVFLFISFSFLIFSNINMVLFDESPSKIISETITLKSKLNLKTNSKMNEPGNAENMNTITRTGTLKDSNRIPIEK